MNSTLTLLRSLLGTVDRGRGRLIASVLLAAAASGASVALMGVAAWLLSRAAEHPPVMYLTAAAVGVRAFGISRGVFRYLERLVGHDVALRMQSALRLETYATLAATTLLGRRRGDLLTRVVADVDAVLDAVVRVIVPFASGGVVILGTTAAIAAFDPLDALVLLASSVVAAAFAPWLARRLSRDADAEAVPARGALADAVHEISRTAPDLVAYGAEDAYLDRMLAVDGRLRRAEQRAAWVRGVATAIQTLGAGFAVVAALVIGSHAVADGRLGRTMLAVLVLVPLALHEVFADFAKAAQTLTRASAALRRVQAVLDAPPVGRGDLDAAAHDPSPAIDLDDVTVGWPGHEPLLTGFDLHVRDGERVALVGPSGVGKTTVAATILGLIPPQAGDVRTRGRLGYLAQDAHLFATSVAENVKIGNKDAAAEQVAAALSSAGLPIDPDRLVGELGATISGGEARRLAASRLLVGDYQAVILDEPSEHLDPATADALLDDLWAAMAGRPMLVITHDPDVVARCDRVVRLDRADAGAAGPAGGRFGV
ncbi:thiol reductant ABC exporter subunit CydC [Nigerium massiliense]|uniref:thiol reductant ABC exporter subunit CydC n=1 Tax=Nigerium massiliense TaxID=1522317 RepID=UPI000693B426|nr:thiol reductant ABC exporter subunit CydC [Nigerium massiliense]